MNEATQTNELTVPDGIGFRIETRVSYLNRKQGIEVRAAGTDRVHAVGRRGPLIGRLRRPNAAVPAGRIGKQVAAKRTFHAGVLLIDAQIAVAGDDRVGDYGCQYA